MYALPNTLQIFPQTYTHAYRDTSWKLVDLFFFNIVCFETVGRWDEVVDGWRMLSPCGVPTGMEGNRTRIISRKCKTAETKCQSWELWAGGRVLRHCCARYVQVWWLWMSEGKSVVSPMLQINHIHQADCLIRHEVWRRNTTHLLLLPCAREHYPPRATRL